MLDKQDKNVHLLLSLSLSLSILSLSSHSSHSCFYLFLLLPYVSKNCLLVFLQYVFNISSPIKGIQAQAQAIAN